MRYRLQTAFMLILLASMSAFAVYSYQEPTAMDRIKELLLGLTIIGIPVLIALAVVLPLVLMANSAKAAAKVAEAAKRAASQPPRESEEKRREKVLDALEDED